MNYYIEGNPDKAEQIKAAFEEKGYRDQGWAFSSKHDLYFSVGALVYAIPYKIRHIITERPDYKELELSVELKFKVGDWLFHNTLGVHPILVKDYSERQGYKVEGLELTYYLQKGIVENEYHLWTISDAKDGDVLVTTKIRSCPFIYRKTSCNNNLAYYYAGIDGKGNFCEGCLKRTLSHFGHVEDVVPATREQRDLLFAKIKEAGYEWDADKKELRKIHPHYDIANFKPKQWVLVRDDDEWEWVLTRFSHLSNGSASLFVCINGASFQQCIPYEGNEHLLGTTDICDEQYKNW